jgi:hypothetical protein
MSLHQYDQGSHDGVPQATDTQSWLEDLELMHNYSHKTSRTRLGASIRLQHLWQDHIPELATKHTFLMHGLLALSALHLATMRPAQVNKYASLCDKHQASALASYRQILTHITDDVAEALFALSTILSISSLARATLKASQMEAAPHISVESICELLYLTRGVREVKEATGERVSRGPFSIVLQGHELTADVQVNLSPKISSVFRELDMMVHVNCADQEQRRSCSEAVTHLRDVFEGTLGKYHINDLEMGQVWRWTAMLSYDFIKMVQAHFPPALVITAYFTVAAMMLREQWFISNWGSLAFGGIRIALKGELEEYLAWPQEQMDSDNAGLKYGGATIETTGSFQDQYLLGGSRGPTPIGQTPMAQTPLAE